MSDFPDLRRLAADSLHGRAVHAVIRIVAAAWQESRLRALTLGLAARRDAAAPDERLRLVASAIATAAVVNAAARAFMPPYSAPGLPITLVVAVALVAAGAAAAPDAVTRAWRHSRYSRLKQR